MAYIKYKELTKYFDFNGKISIDNLPKYVLDYVYEDEKVLAAYKTRRDKAIFTTKRMILFDVTPFIGQKKIHVIPYRSISTSAVLFERRQAAILMSFDSGYQIRLNFVSMSPDDKKNLRLLYTDIMRNVK